MPNQGIVICEVHINDWTVIGFEGEDVELEINGGTEVIKRFLHEKLEAEHDRLILDFSSVTLIDSTVLGVLVGVVRKMRNTGGKLRLASLNVSVQRIFEITGLDAIFEIHPDVESAVS